MLKKIYMFNGKEIRCLVKDGEPYIMLTDLARLRASKKVYPYTQDYNSYCVLKDKGSSYVGINGFHAYIQKYAMTPGAISFIRNIVFEDLRRAEAEVHEIPKRDTLEEMLLDLTLLVDRIQKHLNAVNA